MQRRQFLISTLSAIPALTLLPTIHAFSSSLKPFVIRSHESRFGVPTPFRGIIPNDLKISSKDTDGYYSLFDYIGIERVPGPNLHVHLWQDELFYAVNGEFIFQVGNQKIKIGKGDAVYGPRNIQHTWTQLSATGRLVYFVSPAHKMEEFFVQMSQLKAPPTQAESKKIDDEYGILHRGNPLLPDEQHVYSSTLDNGYVIRAGESRFNEHVSHKNLSPVNLLLSKKDSDQTMSAFDYSGNSKGGPPLHVHHNQDEVFFITEGEYLFQAGDQRFTLSAGDTIFLPRKVPHTWMQLTDKGKLLFFFQPAGKMEEFFKIHNAQTSPPTPEEGARQFAEHEMTVLGPPIFP
ncbi:MAG: cupin domain-containing protein [Cyclobacteriaceae bacterium]|nr:cupin domain-containing protein [Cyclobacteriaceae bacterium]